MRKVLSILGVTAGVALSFQAGAQLSSPRLIITGGSPADGMKQFTISTSSSPSWGGAITAPIIELPVVKAYDSLACATLLNGTATYPSLTNKAALVFRGSCEFSKKALEAQNAGAALVVIVTNNDLGPVGMAGGTYGAQITIPVVMVSKADGLLMNTAILNNQSVKISISYWGFNKTNDVGFIPNSIAEGHGGLIPRVMLSNTNNNPKQYQILNGAIVGNFGSANQSNVMLKNRTTWTPTGGTPTQVWRDSVNLPTFNAIDSLMGLVSPNGYNPHPATTGRYNMDYTLTTTTIDEISGDNIISTYMDVSDTIFNKGRWDALNQRPVYTVGYRYGSTTVSNYNWGPMYYIGAQYYRAVKSQLVISDASNPAGPLDAADPVEVTVWKWEDANGDGVMHGSETEIAGAGIKNFAVTDTSGRFFTVDLINQIKAGDPVQLDSGYNYWVSVGASNTVFLGCDGNYSQFTRSYTQDRRTPSVREIYAPQYPGTSTDFQSDTADSYPFTGQNDIDSVGFIQQIGLIPAVSLHITKYTPNSIANVKYNQAQVSVSPNPAQSNVTVQVKLEKAAKEVHYSLYNAFGQRIETVKRGALSQDSYTFNVSNLAAGNYFILVWADGVPSSQKFTVTK